MNDDNKTSEDYRRILATANKLEHIQSNLESVIDFFLTPIVKLYSKLCNDCLKLLFECEFKLEHFRKAEELVWRRVYHDIYRFQKTKRRLVKKQDEFLIEAHFISGIGFYSSLIIKLRSNYKINEVKSIINPLNMPLGPIDYLIDDQRLNQDDNEGDQKSLTTNDVDLMLFDESNDGTIDALAQQWARQAIYRSLVYMGDLARYLLEISQTDYRKLAFDFYRSASRYQPDYGLPFNQLATLAGGSNQNLNAVCNYMRCCMRSRPFDGAEGNMRKIFELNKKFYEEISSANHVAKISEVLASQEPAQAAESMMRMLIVIFIKLASDLWDAVSGNYNDKVQDEVVEEAAVFFKTLREAIELEPIVPFTGISSLDLPFCPISIGSNYEEKPKYVSSTIMYQFCNISLMLIARCQSCQFSKGCLTGPINQGIIDLSNTLALNLLHYAALKCKKMIMSKVQEIRVSRQDMDLLEKSSSDNQPSNHATLAFIYNKTYLPTVKVYFDWLLSNGSVINSNLQSFQDFHTELLDTVSLLHDLREMAESNSGGSLIAASDMSLNSSSTLDQQDRSSIYAHVFDGPEWIQKYPLSCDFPLVGLSPLKNAHELNIDFTYDEELSDAEGGCITIQCVMAFSEALTAFLESKAFQ